MTRTIAPLFGLMLSLVLQQTTNTQQTTPSSPGSTQARKAEASDCRAEYQRLTKSLDQITARLDAAERSSDARARRSAVIEARRLLANVKARVAACETTQRR